MEHDNIGARLDSIDAMLKTLAKKLGVGSITG
jgi:hypothetical protein